MATATVHTVPPEPAMRKVETVVLELSGEEAKVLSDLLWRVEGSRYNSPRQYTDNIREALGRAGISKGYFPTESMRGYIAYKECTVRPLYI